MPEHYFYTLHCIVIRIVQISSLVRSVAMSVASACVSTLSTRAEFITAVGDFARYDLAMKFARSLTASDVISILGDVFSGTQRVCVYSFGKRS